MHHLELPNVALELDLQGASDVGLVEEIAERLERHFERFEAELVPDADDVSLVLEFLRLLRNLVDQLLRWLLLLDLRNFQEHRIDQLALRHELVDLVEETVAVDADLNAALYNLRDENKCELRDPKNY